MIHYMEPNVVYLQTPFLDRVWGYLPWGKIKIRWKLNVFRMNIFRLPRRKKLLLPLILFVYDFFYVVYLIDSILVFDPWIPILMSSGSDIGLKMGYLLVSLISIYVGAPLVESLGALDGSMDDTIKAHYAEHKNDILFFLPSREDTAEVSFQEVSILLESVYAWFWEHPRMPWYLRDKLLAI